MASEDAQHKQMIEDIATNIAKLSRQVGDILGGRLKKEAIVTLLVHSTKLSRHDVSIVLDALVNLEKNNLK